ncbi:hypothetical protein A1O3_04415 [Capronia epimyces CBS 606.96]|uniref:Uncharacterized protein n=1 Tax=Capronia epimyces CBS 606.96 TaxID=1182542 RepID=W9YCS6_9EURO|nr:uncharacterized protein A1O3_04415 [Capronia epimyces CBS 606.96]EXJ87455.1 hypothetical protein A1O3_04415 [Capronia epimyces CBS 606.96]
MSFRNVMKDGWHPKGKDGGKESWRGDFKGINQVAGWMGKTRDPSKEDAADHVSRPLSTLKDPALFGPPPKNVNYHGGAALPHEVTPHTNGWGAPLTPEQIQTANQVARDTPQEEEEQDTRPSGPPLPYRADRTGLRTDHLPPPPVHRDITRSPSTTDTRPPKPKPGLPPRLPSRQNTGASITPPLATASPPPQHAPPAYDSIPSSQPSSQGTSNYGINQAAVNRLGTAGVSVPALGISANPPSNPWQNEPAQSRPQPATNQLSELQSRFARMSTSNTGQQQPTTPPIVSPTQSPPPVTSPVYPTLSPSPSQTQPQNQGSTWAEKQATLRTAQNIHRDPSTVSVSDARSAASSANAFRERHQDTLNAAGQKASQWNKKYNVTGRLNSFLEKHSSPTSETPPAVNTSVPSPQLQGQTQSPSPEIVASISRKPPPPPPPKKPAVLHAAAHSPAPAGTPSPPPVPLGTRPSYS